MGFTPVNRTRSQQYFGWGSVGSFRFYHSHTTISPQFTITNSHISLHSTHHSIRVTD
ncbi:hypothetical protein LINPERPRIM_LOCUS22603 [Linum perenne]